jgi:hypothetical protein
MIKSISLEYTIHYIHAASRKYFLNERTAIMYKTIRCFIDENHQVRLLEKMELPAGKNALITILDQEDADSINESAYLSEASLAKDWSRVEEDRAWSSLRAEA